jgi:hypothetical protein
MKIRIHSLLKQLGWKYCFLQENFSINKYWGDRIINIGWAACYIVLDFRKNWFKDMITGEIE